MESDPDPPVRVWPGLFYLDELNIPQRLPRNIALFEFNKYRVGKIIGNEVLELYDCRGEVIFQEKLNPVNQKIVGLEGAKKLGIPGTLQNVHAAIELFKKEHILAKIQSQINSQKRQRH